MYFCGWSQLVPITQKRHYQFSTQLYKCQVIAFKEQVFDDNHKLYFNNIFSKSLGILAVLSFVFPLKSPW